MTIYPIKKPVGKGWISIHRKSLAPVMTEVIRAQMVSRKVEVGKENMHKRDLNCPSTHQIVPAIVVEVGRGSSKPSCSDVEANYLKAMTHFPHKGNNESNHLEIVGTKQNHLFRVLFLFG